MPYTMSWLYPGRVLYTRVSGSVSLDELHAYNADLIKQMRSERHLIHAVLHHDNITRIPRDVLTVRRALTALDEPNIGWIIHVSESRSPWLYVGLLMSRMTGTRGHVTTTVDDALTFLKNEDTTLPDLRWGGVGDD